MATKAPPFAEIESVVLGEEKCYVCRSQLVVPSPTFPTWAECSNSECRYLWKVGDGWIRGRPWDAIEKIARDYGPENAEGVDSTP